MARKPIVPVFAGAQPAQSIPLFAGDERKLPKEELPLAPARLSIGLEWHIVVAGILLLLILVAYGNSFQSEWVLDNKYIIELDPRTKAVQWSDGAPNPAPAFAGVRNIFTQDYWWPKGISGLYRPLTSFTYWLNWTVFGNGHNASPREQVVGFHWINLAIHFLNAFLFYRLMLRLTKRFWVSFFASVIFAMHPIATESVTNIIGRADMFAATTVVGGMLIWIDINRSAGWKRIAWLVALMLLLAFGVFSKESAGALVFVALLYDLVYRWRDQIAPVNWRGWRSALLRRATIIPLLFFALCTYLLVIQPAVQQLGNYSCRYLYNSSISPDDPGIGSIKLDSATVSAAKLLRISHITSQGVSLVNKLFAPGEAKDVGGEIRIAKLDDPHEWASFRVDGILNGSADWDALSLEYVNGDNHGFANFEPVVVTFLRPFPAVKICIAGLAMLFLIIAAIFTSTRLSRLALALAVISAVLLIAIGAGYHPQRDVAAPKSALGLYALRLAPNPASPQVATETARALTDKKPNPSIIRIKAVSLVGLSIFTLAYVAAEGFFTFRLRNPFAGLHAREWVLSVVRVVSIAAVTFFASCIYLLVLVPWMSEMHDVSLPYIYSSRSTPAALPPSTIRFDDETIANSKALYISSSRTDAKSLAEELSGSFEPSVTVSRRVVIQSNSDPTQKAVFKASGTINRRDDIHKLVLQPIEGKCSLKDQESVSVTFVDGRFGWLLFGTMLGLVVCFLVPVLLATRLITWYCTTAIVGVLLLTILAVCYSPRTETRPPGAGLALFRMGLAPNPSTSQMQDAAGMALWAHEPNPTLLQLRAICITALVLSLILFVGLEICFRCFWPEDREDSAVTEKWRGFFDGYYVMLSVAVLLFVVRDWVFANTTPAEEPFLDNPIRVFNWNPEWAPHTPFWTNVGHWFGGRFTAFNVAARLMWKLIWPVKLSADYSYDQIPLIGWNSGAWDDVAAVFSLLVIVASIVLAIYCIRKNQKAIAFFIFLYWINYFPTSNFLLVIGSIMAERFMYLPLIGFAACVAIGVDLIARKFVGSLDDPEGTAPAVSAIPAKYRYVPHIVLGVLVVLYGVRAFYRNYAWHTDVTLWEAAKAESPRSFRSYQSYAFALFEQDQAGNCDKMIQTDEDGLKIVNPLPNPLNSSRLYLHLGMYYGLKGEIFMQADLLTLQTENALRVIRDRLQPEYRSKLDGAVAAVHTATASGKPELVKRATDELQALAGPMIAQVHVDPPSVDPANVPDAVPWFEQSARILERGVPIDRAFNQINRDRDIERGQNGAETPDVGLAPVYGYLGVAYLRLNKLDEAERTFLYMRHLECTDADAYLKLASVEERRHRPDREAVYLMQVILLDSSHQEAWQALNQCFNQINHEPYPCIIVTPEGHMQLDLSRQIVKETVLEAYRGFVRAFLRAKRIPQANAARDAAIKQYGFLKEMFDGLYSPDDLKTFPVPVPPDPIYWQPPKVKFDSMLEGVRRAVLSKTDGVKPQWLQERMVDGKAVYDTIPDDSPHVPLVRVSEEGKVISD